jgi:hypothetical protein
MMNREMTAQHLNQTLRKKVGSKLLVYCDVICETFIIINLLKQAVIMRKRVTMMTKKVAVRMILH